MEVLVPYRETSPNEFITILKDTEFGEAPETPQILTIPFSPYAEPSETNLAKECPVFVLCWPTSNCTSVATEFYTINLHIKTII